MIIQLFLLLCLKTMNKIEKTFVHIIFVINILLFSSCHYQDKALSLIERRGPLFIVEPPNAVSFLNDTGTIITCSARGIPSPTITWTKQDGMPLHNVAGLRQIRIDGSSVQLVYLPFGPNDYRQDIHSTTVRCIASNPVGVIESRECHVRASVKQHYEVQVYDDFVIKSNTGILRCHIPSFIKEYVSVTSWLRSDGLTIHSNLANGGRYSLSSIGELHIHKADPINDGQHQYRCQTKHRLSGEVKLSSNAGRLVVTESHSNIPPKIIQTSARYILGVIQETIQLPCITQGYPRPDFSWFKINNKALDKIISQNYGSRFLQIDGSLIIKQATISDSGKYVCISNNSVGQDKAETELLVRGPLSVVITPNNIIAKDGKSVTLNCTVIGFPVSKVTWKKNAINIVINNRIKLINDERTLHISPVKREDKGMFQCIASNEFESAQGAAEITLGDEPPHFTNMFIQPQPLQPGHGLSLKCTATGLPLPQITWTLDSNQIYENMRVRIGDFVTGDGYVNSYVNISSVRTEDGGIYTCTASNDGSSISHSGKVNVYGAPFIRSMNNETVLSGEVFSIQCPAAGFPLESIIWSKQGVKLPQNRRQTVFPNGTLIIDKVERSDEDVYRCSVSASGAFASRDVFVKVLVAPVINPFSSPPNLREGMRGMLTCSVLEGDPPVKIQFLKDSKLLRSSPDNHIKIDSTNEFSSTLFISKVSFEDSGNYTCIASNSAASNSYSVKMIVNVLPKWIIAPTNTEVVVGQNVIIDCTAMGDPRIWWEKAELTIEDSKPISNHFRTVISNSHIHTLENGSLTIREVSEEDEGEYMCQANNGVGSGLSKVVRLNVHVPAYFKSKFSAQTIKKGEQMELMCDAFGEKPITVTFTKDHMQFDPTADPRYQVVKTERKDGISVILKIQNCDRRDSALFQCTAANSYGRDEYNVQVIVQERPDKIDNLKLSQIESRNVQLIWVPPYTGNSFIISYQIECKEKGKTWETQDKIAHNVPGTENSYIIRGLNPITSYEIRMRCENNLGASDYSDVHQFSTSEEAPSGPPINAQVFPLSARSLQVTWQAPKPETRNGQIVGYYLGYKVHDSSEPYVFKTISANDLSFEMAHQKEIKLTDLKRSTKYSIIVQAFNNKGPGPQSEEIYGETLENDPPKAPILLLGHVDYSSIELNWKIDDSEGEDDVRSSISGYYIYIKRQLTDWEERQISGRLSSFTVSDLNCGTQYQFYAVAYNSVGKGEPSQAIAVRTKGSSPIAPKQSSFILINSTSALLNLDSWMSNGCSIKYFIIKYKSKHDNDWILVSNSISPQQKHIELIDLSPGTWYSLHVIAHSDAGPTEQLYNYATLTLSGATVSPLDMTRPSSFTYQNLTIVIPFGCAVIVLTVISFVACFVYKKRLPNDSVAHCNIGNHDQMCVRDERCSDGFHLAVLDPRKEECCSSEQSVSPTKEIYFPSPYAMNRIQMIPKQRQQHCVESDLSSLHSLRRSRHEHVYDIPFPPKWV